MEITLNMNSIRLIDRKVFVKRVIEHSQKTRTYKEAYEKTEAEFENVFGKNKYSSYESFKVGKHREQKKGKPNNTNQLKLF